MLRQLFQESKNEEEKEEEEVEEEHLHGTSVQHRKDNGITIIRIGRSDWPKALWPVSSLCHEFVVVHILPSDMMLLRPKTRPDVFISRERACARPRAFQTVLQHARPRHCHP